MAAICLGLIVLKQAYVWSVFCIEFCYNTKFHKARNSKCQIYIWLWAYKSQHNACKQCGG